MNNPLELAHRYWKELLTAEDLAVDATCGNGYDTLVLAKLAGEVEAWDIQEDAIRNTRARTKECLNIRYRQGCHSLLVKTVSEPLALATFNLGYLPGGDKGLTTRVETTLGAVEAMCPLLKEGGALSIVCYPGHPEGAREEETLLRWAEWLPQKSWCAIHHRFSNRGASPSLLWIQRTRQAGSSCP